MQDTDPLLNTPDCGPDHQHILNSLCAAEQVDNTPQCQSPEHNCSGRLFPIPTFLAIFGLFWHRNAFLLPRLAMLIML